MAQGVLVVLALALGAVVAEALQALEALQYKDTLLKMYRLEPSACTALDGIPLAIGLIKEEEEADAGAGAGKGWGAAYFTMSYLDDSVGRGKLETGTFSPSPSSSSSSSTTTTTTTSSSSIQRRRRRRLEDGKKKQQGAEEEEENGGEVELHDTIDTRSICLRKDMQYIFQLSRNPNAFEIGALVGKTDFIGPDDAVHITTWDGQYKSRVKRRTSQLRLEMTYNSLPYAYADNRVPPSLSPTVYPTWSRFPTAKPTNFRQTSQSQACLESIPGYSVAWTLADYCSIYSSSGCTAEQIQKFSCVPAYFQQSKACGSTFCDMFSLLSNVCIGSLSPALYNITNKHTISYQKTVDGCLETFQQEAYNATELTRVNWRVSLRLQGASSSQLSSDEVSKTAVKAALCQFLPGVVMSSVTFETVEAIKITNAPSRSPSYVRVTPKSPQPTLLRQRGSKAPSPLPVPTTARPTRATNPPYSSPAPTRWRQLTRQPSRQSVPSPAPSPAPTFPPGSAINATGIFVTLTIISSIQQLGYSDEATAFEASSNNLKNAAATNALSFALREQAKHYNASAIKFAVVLKNDAMLTSLGTLPPAATPVSSDANTEDPGLIAGATVGAVAGVGVGGAVAYQAYKVFGVSKELVQVMPAEQMQMLDVVPLKF